MSVIWNVAFVGASVLSLAYRGWSALGLAFFSACVAISVKAQFSDQVKVRDTSQLIRGMSKLLQKLLKCFNGTAI